MEVDLNLAGVMRPPGFLFGGYRDQSREEAPFRGYLSQLDDTGFEERGEENPNLLILAGRRMTTDFNIKLES